MPLKIAIVTEYYYPLLGGITENVHYTATKLRRLGHAVTIVTSHAHEGGLTREESSPDAADVVRIGRSVPVLTNGSTGQVSVGRHLSRELQAVFREGHFDIAHVHSPLTPTLPALAVRNSTCACVGTFHTYFERSPIYGLFRGSLQRRFLDKLDARTFVSKSCVDSMGRYFTLADPRIIPNGIDVDRFHPEVPRLERFDRRKLTLLWLGRFDPRNGLGYMLKAFEIVRRQFPEARLVIVGHGRSRNHHERLVPAALREDVHFEGPAVESRPAHYSTCDVFCSPVSRASFGITLLEAMATGKPIVATANVGYRDLLGPEEGVLVPPDDVEAFAAAILQLLRDERLRADMGRAGRQKALRYSWDRIVGDTVSLYEEVLQRP